MTLLRYGLRARRRVLAAGADRAAAASRRRLARDRHAQLERFAELAPRFADRYRALAAAAPPAVTPWTRYAGELERSLLPVPPASFLRLPVVMETMLPHSARARRRQLAYLRGRMSAGALSTLLAEDAVGDPVLVRPYPTSSNRIHQLTHVERFSEIADVDCAEVASVVEWGGGYGAMCRLWRLRGPATYTILDLPIVSCLQWLYLASVLGEDEVVLHDRAGTPVPGRVNLMPADAGAELAADVFVSTWALSESPPALQDAVAAGRFFGAGHLLLAFQRGAADFPGAANLASIARRNGMHLEPVLGYRSSSYAFS